MNLSDLALFLRITECGNITTAAQELDMSSAKASAALKRLEAQLGCALFIRTTRKLRLTAAGERFLPHCQDALNTLQTGISQLGHDDVLSGNLTLSLPSDLGRNLLLPWLDHFLAEHPALSVRLEVGDHLADFYHDRIDLAIRYGKPDDSSLVAFPLCTTRRVICASPDYLRKAGTPQHPQDLQQHNCLLYLLGERTHDLWHFNTQDETIRVRVHGNRICNDADLVRRWAIAGQGIALKSALDLTEDLKAGRLHLVLTDFTTEPLHLWLVCPSRSQVSPAVRLMRESLRAYCQQLAAYTSD